METEDDRTPEQRKTHCILVIGTDRCLSGWGLARNGASYAIWACRPEDHSAVERWVEGRSDMKRVRVTVEPYRPNSRYCAHAHTYVVGPGHPALA